MTDEIKLPPMPEWAKMDNLNGMVPSEIRSALNEFGREAVRLNAQAVPDEERLAMEAVMESIDPATWPGLTVSQRCALGRFAKHRPAEPVQSDCRKECVIGDSNYAAGMLLGWNLCIDNNEEKFNRIRRDRLRAAAQASHASKAHDAAQQPAEPVKRKRRYAQGTALGEFGILPMCDQVDDEPVKVPSDDLAHEIWAAAQTAPGEGIEDAVERIAALLARRVHHDVLPWESAKRG